MIEFFFDCSSPWTYLAFHNIQPLAKEFDEEISWRPILVGGIFNTINPSVYARREHPVPAKVAYDKKDIADWARDLRPDHQDAADGVSGEQRQGDARLHLARQRHAAVCAHGVPDLLGRRPGHLAGRGAGRSLPARRHRFQSLLCRHRSSSRSRMRSRPIPTKSWRAAGSARRRSSSTRPTCISATTACR